MDLNKKGIVFTSLVVILSIIIISSFLFLYRAPIDPDLNLAEPRIKNTNYFISQSDRYISNILSTTLNSAINDIIQISLDYQDFIPNFEQRFYECVLEGEFELESTRTCSETSNLNTRIQEFKELTQQNLNINFDVDIKNIEILHTRPFSIDLRLTYNFLVEDGYGSWNISRTTTGRTSIEGFRDLTFEFVDETKESIKFERFIQSGGRASGQWREIPHDLNNLTREGQYFANNQFGVTFLNRLKGNHTPSQYGIISIIEPYQVNVFGELHLDTYFWNNNCEPSIDKVEINFDSVDFLTFEQMGLTTNTGLQRAIIPLALAEVTNTSNTVYATPTSIC